MGRQPTRFGKSPLSKLILARIDQMGKPRKDLARAIGVDESQLSRWFGLDSGGPSGLQLQKIGEYTGIPLTVLMRVSAGEEIGLDQAMSEQREQPVAATDPISLTGARGKLPISSILAEEIQEMYAEGWKEKDLLVILNMCKTIGKATVMRRILDTDGNSGRHRSGSD